MIIEIWNRITTVFKRNVTHNVRRLEFLEVSLYQPHRSEEWNILKSFIVKHTQELAKNKSENKYTIQSKKKKNTNTNTNTWKGNRSEHLYKIDNITFIQTNILYFTYCETQHSYFNTSQAIFFNNLWALVLQNFHSSS